MWQLVTDHWRLLAAPLGFTLSLWASAHVILYKREIRATIAWVGFIWLMPFLGPLFYALFGINRIRRRARTIRGRTGLAPIIEQQASRAESPADGWTCRMGESAPGVLPDGIELVDLGRLVGRLTGKPLLPGNQVEPLVDGDAAYPAMLAAIDRAERTLSLSTYIFDNDPAGREFLEALRKATAHGVEVRVIIDDVGAQYSLPSMTRALRRARVPVARFLPRWLPWSMPYTNLRNHRKILVADGRVGFTGGLNIRQGHRVKLHPLHPVQDLHFRVEGPVVAHLQEVFAEDWEFCTGEVLQGENWFPQLQPTGPTLARGIPDGPDKDFEKLRLTLLGGLSCARSSVRIMTPYFLPDTALITALNVASLRGIQVDILLPERNNLLLVQWASTALLWQVLEQGCRVWLTPPPFDHTKLMVVDDAWSLLGSANWDPRSLRLNFEFNLECHDRELAGKLVTLIESRRAASRQVTLADVDGRSLAVKLRDGVARLLSPYL
jgi:cardiolipin synthase A/B